MLKAVLFDMDGVIVDTEPLHRKAYFKMFEEVKIDVNEELYDSFTGQATLPICRTLCEHFSLTDTPEHLVTTKRKHFKYLFENDTSLDLLDGVYDLIKNYYENDLTLVLASSASMPNINRIFDRFDLNKYFKAKISGADLKASKPHPEIFIKAAELAGQPTENCMVIEDSTNGIKAAKAANIYCVGFKSPHSVNQDYTKADKVITSFDEILYEKLTDLS
ncbi:HAD family phosphatase [Aequorivita sp. KMM 9714]|uniref:HAD family hydrolase n=1 Tax=Aequorivita sp. KMM 9714 TaxID=2707173 RepID=UPI0013ECC925|nr:HAD family phosphatase [Aequorivita sp. KMM 9714]NGX84531.1 HAD family phosphatase [Aequorivita sp. KMM 9714]